MGSIFLKGPRLLNLLFWVFFFGSSLITCPAWAVQEQKAILELTLNNISQGEVFVILRDKDVLIRRLDLEKAGLQNFAGVQETINNEIYVSLGSLNSSITYEFDEKSLSLRITAQTQLLGTTSLNLGNTSPKNIVYTQDTSAFLNYAFNIPLDEAKLNDYTFFGESGLSLNGNLLYSNFSRKADGNIVRGLTNFTINNPKNLTRWVVGDSFANSGNLGGSLFLGGVSLSKEFNLNPYFTRQPTFGLSGAVITPSTVEVLVNGQRVSQRDVPPGKFELNNLVLPVGNGSTKVVIRDAFGKEQVINSPFYFSTGLLKPGLSDYSFNLGFRRDNLDTDSFNYGSSVFLGRYTQGITDSLTIGGRLETSSDLISGGTTLTTALPFGAVELSLAASNESGNTGTAASLAYSYSSRSVGFGGAVRLFSDQYANLSLKAADDRPNLEYNGFVSSNLARGLSVGLQYAAADSRDRGHSDRLSLYSTIQLSDRANISINLSRSSQDLQSTNNEIFIGFNYYLGDTSASLSEQINEQKATTTLSLQKSAPVGEGFGYRLQLTPSEAEVPANARFTYRAPFGIYELNYDRNNNGGEATTLNASGSVVAIGKNIFFTRPITQSFALLQVPGVAGVRGYVSNQEMGRTDRNGNLLIPHLLPYYGNNIKMQDEDIPLNYKIGANDKVIAPPLRGGAIVRFSVQRIQSFIGTIAIESSGKTEIPAYGQLTVNVNDKPIISPIGSEGNFYLEDNIAPGSYTAKVEYAQGTCDFTVNIPQSEQLLVNLGRLKCIFPQK
ncbi:fimbrial biogenesis outer membrane usher protein [Richelia sinica FACHB-800]|nr:fimbrial biogenesis outer membrane usher protein [Richelia sinica FACHB-800]